MQGEPITEPTARQQPSGILKDLLGEGVLQIVSSIVTAPFKAVGWLIGQILDGVWPGLA